MQRKSTEFEAWLAKYGPVEQAILAARERRLENRRKRAARRAKLLGDLCEATEGRAKAWEAEERAKAQAGEKRFDAWTPKYRNRAWAPKDHSGTRVHESGIRTPERTAADGDPFVVSDVVIAVLAPYLRHVRATATKCVKRLTDAARRPLYYERENTRRRALAAARRKVVKRQTLNARPTREAILDAWVHRRDSHEASIRFGGLVMDLECYLDNSLLFAEGGAICGRRGGVKRWLQTEIPALYLRYGTVMRYKAHAAKLRQIVELSDPIPVSRILQDAAPQDASSVGPKNAATPETPDCASKDAATPNAPERDYVAETNSSAEHPGHDLVRKGDDCNAPGTVGAQAQIVASGAKGRNGTERTWSQAEPERTRELTVAEQIRALTGVENMPAAGEQTGQCGTAPEAELARMELRVLRGRAIWLEVTKGIRNNPTALMARIDALLDPENISEATLLAGWRAKYENEITLRRRKSWRGRLFGIGRKWKGMDCA